MAASVTSFQQHTNNVPVGTGTTVGATYLNGVTDAINHLERLIWSDSETAPTETDLLFNARYTGTAWTRINASSAVASRIKLDNSRLVTYSHVAAGTGAITWVDKMIDDIPNGLKSGGLRKIRNLKITTPSTTTLSVSHDGFLGSDGTTEKPFSAMAATTLDTATTGANAMDTGTLAASTLYSVWLIGKADGTKASLASLSFTAPTMPSGYTFKLLISQFYTNGSSLINSFYQQDNQWFLEQGVTAGIMLPVNGVVPNSANWQTANCSTWIHSQWGKVLLIVEGFLGGASAGGTQFYLSVGAGGSFLGNTLNGCVIAGRVIFATTPQVTSLWLGIGTCITDGTANQQIRWKIHVADAAAAATVNIIGFIVPI